MHKRAKFMTPAVFAVMISICGAMGVLVEATGCASDENGEYADESESAPQDEIRVLHQELWGCRPGPDEVSLFVNPDFNGHCVTLRIGKYTYDKVGLPDNTISSYIVGEAVYLRYTEHRFWGKGRYSVGNAGSVPRLGSWDNHISAVEVYPASFDRWLQVPPEGHIALFADPGYAGDSTFVSVAESSRSNVVLDLGFSRYVSSIRVHPSVKARLCSADRQRREWFEAERYDFRRGTAIGDNNTYFVEVFPSEASLGPNWETAPCD